MAGLYVIFIAVLHQCPQCSEPPEAQVHLDPDDALPGFGIARADSAVRMDGWRPALGPRRLKEIVCRVQRSIGASSTYLKDSEGPWFLCVSRRRDPEPHDRP